MVQFKKLLPYVMRNTRWGELVEVVQNIDNEIRTEVINPIFDRSVIEKATSDELKSMLKQFGFKVLTYPGTYTSTLEYLQRQAKTIATRIKYKTTKKSYRYLAYVYGLYGEAFGCQYNTSEDHVGQFNTIVTESPDEKYSTVITDQEGDNLYFTLSTEEGDFPVYGTPQSTGLQISYTDTDTAIETDDYYYFTFEDGRGALITQIVRNIIYSYRPMYLETELAWLTTYSLMSLKNDTDQIHKATERVYYEPHLKINTSISGTTTLENYYSYDFSISGVVASVLKGSSLLDATFIQFGTGNHWTSISGIPSDISGVQSLSFSIPSGVVSGVVYDNLPSGVGGWNFFDSGISTHLDFDFYISEFNKFTSFSEIALLDSSSVCIYYGSFPTVQWASSMYNNIRINVNLV